eukprot:2780850-Amphidinium_carterae.1
MLGYQQMILPIHCKQDGHGNNHHSTQASNDQMLASLLPILFYGCQVHLRSIMIASCPCKHVGWHVHKVSEAATIAFHTLEQQANERQGKHTITVKPETA